MLYKPGVRGLKHNTGTLGMKLILIAVVIWISSSFAILFGALAAQPVAVIGKAVKVVNKVDLETNGTTHKIVKGSSIRTRETVTTGKKSSSQFTMRDDTRLAIGPNARLLLDKFVYDPDPQSRQMVLENLKGALRFVTGNNPSDTYTVNTPSAVIGVRGTMFDIYIDNNNRTMLALLKGKVNVCPPGADPVFTPSQCRNVTRAGNFLAITRQGRIITSDRAGRSILGAVPFATAFPFLAARRRLSGKLAAPARLRQRIRVRAGLGTPRRKKPPRRHGRKRSNYQDDGDFDYPIHRRSLSTRQDDGPYPVHRRVKSRYDHGGSRPPRHRKSISRRQDGDYDPPTRHKKSTSRREDGIRLLLRLPKLRIFKNRNRRDDYNGGNGGSGTSR